MRPTFLSFETTKRTIQAAQKSLDITNNNIANRETEGYTRQRVDLYSMYTNISGVTWNSPTAKLSLAGQGVKAAGVAQIRDQYIDKRYRDITAYEAEYSNTHSILSEVEDVLDNIETDGLKVMVEEFESYLSTYSGENPDSTELANVVRNSALNITQMLKNYGMKLDQIQEGVVQELQITVDGFNTLTEKIASLNKQIAVEYTRNFGDPAYEKISVTANYGPNELLDARNLLLDQLAEYGNISVSDNADGSVKVMVGDTAVVDGTKTTSLIMRDYDDYGAAVLVYDNGDDVNISHGLIKSYTDLINGNGVYHENNSNQTAAYGIPYYKSVVDQFAKTFADTMNNANGANKPSSLEFDPASRLMFTSSDGNPINSSNIQISDVWTNDATMIAQVYDKDTGKYSDSVSLENSNVLILKQALNEKVNFGIHGDFKGTMHEYIAFYTNRLAQQMDYTESQRASAETTVLNLLESRDNISAVDMEEEGVNMLNYQKWFNASARMLTVLDEALDMVINNMGLVGR